MNKSGNKNSQGKGERTAGIAAVRRLRVGARQQSAASAYAGCGSANRTTTPSAATSAATTVATAATTGSIAHLVLQQLLVLLVLVLLLLDLLAAGALPAAARLDVATVALVGDAAAALRRAGIALEMARAALGARQRHGRRAHEPRDSLVLLLLLLRSASQERRCCCRRRQG